MRISDWSSDVCSSDLLVTLHDRAASLGEADWRGTALTLEEHWDGLCAGDPIPRADVPPEGIAALLYTSGSTGRPKGVMVSHANLWLGAESVARYLELEAGDRVLAQIGSASAREGVCQDGEI